jgi:hypothetical protein
MRSLLRPHADDVRDSPTMRMVAKAAISIIIIIIFIIIIVVAIVILIIIIIKYLIIACDVSYIQK